ncbi:MAG: ABC transporter ATP-binding protein [Euryarchaeota archaeon]|nr:ABC transporter ATP-binding protein [Euryarchaeota archaeon]
MDRPLFEIRGLEKRFGAKLALAGIDLDIMEGEVFAFLGPSGAGKTTLLRVLNTLERPSSGRVAFQGVGISELDSRGLLEVRRRMVLLAQGAPLFNTTVRGNLAYPLKVRGIGGREMERRVVDALDSVGMTGYQDRDARTLSGGERQRVALAMAAIFEPRVLLLDEPTANLDPINEEMVWGIIERMREEGVTVILATHKLAEARRLADRIGVLREGRMEQIGSAREIFTRPKTGFVARFTKRA